MRKEHIVLGTVVVIISILLIAANIPEAAPVDEFVDDYGTDYGAVGVWNFEEGTGTTAFDQSPYGNDGYISGATWAAGKFGEALTFDGVGDYVTVLDSASLDISDYMTIEAWAKDPPNTVTLNDPAEDGSIYYDGAYSRFADGIRIQFRYRLVNNIYRGYVEWDISSIPDTATIVDVVFKYHGEQHEAARPSHITHMSSQPTATADATVYADIADGTKYLDNSATFPIPAPNRAVGTGGDEAWSDLATLKTDLEGRLADDWFAIGLMYATTDFEKTRVYTEEQPGVTPAPTLYVEYTVPDVHKVIVEKDDAYSLYINYTSFVFAKIDTTEVRYDVPVVTDWHYYSMTYDNVTLKLYVDGELVNSTALTGAIPLNNNNVTIGTRFLGEIDQVRIYKVAKTLGEIRNHYLNSGHMYSGSVIVSDDFKILNTTFGERIGLDDSGLDLNHYYILESDFSHWDSFIVSGGKTDELLNIMPAGLATQDRHFHRITLAVNTGPGVGKEFNITLTDGIGSMFISLTGAETSDYDDINGFDWDVSADTLTLKYSQDAGGSVTNAFVTIKYHYKETP